MHLFPSLLVLLLLLILPSSFLSLDCSVSDPSKLDCGYYGINQGQCEGKGCCWASASSSSIPWCFYPNGTPDVCSTLSFTASGPGFTDADFKTLEGYFTANLNIQNKGGVVAAPDYNTPGGSYYYAWARDSALSMKSYMTIHDFDYNSIKDYMNSYVEYELKVHSESDPNVDVRVEAKFNLPEGDPFLGGWCRPQTDGPGLRATTFSLYSKVLIDNGQTDYVRQKLYTSGAYNGGLIKADLDWVINHWSESGCDLWEEIRSDNFFWGRFTMRRGLLEGAKIADLLGDSAMASKYRQVAQDIQKTLSGHWTGSFIKESDSRQQDASVVSAFTDGYTDDEVFKPTDIQIAGTIKTLNNLFCHSYLINQQDTKNGIPGVLYGRYQGDTYAGGNPWVLLTADLAKVFYRGASLIFKEKQLYGKAKLNQEQYNAWAEAMNLDKNTFIKQFLSNGDVDLQLGQAMLAAGDAVLQRIYYHVKADNFHLDEQIDRNTGVQMSAKDLTWSYATVLVALKLRTQALNNSHIQKEVSI